jgi:hypothetical protein
MNRPRSGGVQAVRVRRDRRRVNAALLRVALNIMIVFI